MTFDCNKYNYIFENHLIKFSAGQ